MADLRKLGKALTSVIKGTGTAARKEEPGVFAPVDTKLVFSPSTYYDLPKLQETYRDVLSISGGSPPSWESWLQQMMEMGWIDAARKDAALLKGPGKASGGRVQKGKKKSLTSVKVK